MIDVWHLGRVNWLRTLPPEASKRLQEAADARRFDRGARIFAPVREPQHVYLLEEGLARIYRCSVDGQEVTLGFVQEGEVFGELAAFSDKPRESFAEAARPCTVWRIPRDLFVDVLRSSPDCFFEVTKQVEGRFKRIESRVEDLVFHNARERIAHILLELAADLGVERDGATVIDFPLTQEDVAQLIGATRQTTSTNLHALREQGVLRRAGRRLVIEQPEVLRRIAAGETDA